MSTITMKDGMQIYYKDWNTGQAVVFSHDWPLSADSRKAQMMFLASNGNRCIAHERHGHSRSSEPWNDNEIDTCAADPSQFIETVDLKEAVLIGFSAGGRGAVSVFRLVAQPDYCRRRDELGFCLGHRQRLATAKSETMIDLRKMKTKTKTLSPQRLRRKRDFCVIRADEERMIAKTACDVLGLAMASEKRNSDTIQ